MVINSVAENKAGEELGVPTTIAYYLAGKICASSRQSLGKRKFLT